MEDDDALTELGDIVEIIRKKTANGGKRKHNAESDRVVKKTKFHTIHSGTEKNATDYEQLQNYLKELNHSYREQNKFLQRIISAIDRQEKTIGLLAKNQKKIAVCLNRKEVYV